MPGETPRDPNNPLGSTGRKRNEVQRGADFKFIAEHYLKGYRCAAIAELLAAERPYRIGRTVIGRELHKLDKMWREEAIDLRDKQKRLELARCDARDVVLWQCLIKAMQEKVKKRGKKTGSAAGDGAMGALQKIEQSVETQDTAGDPRWMALLIANAKIRMELLGLNEPTMLEITEKQATKPVLPPSVEEALQKLYGDRAIAALPGQSFPG